MNTSIRDFSAEITDLYSFESDSIVIGAAMHDSKVLQGVQVKAPLKTFNRHGLIAGATGTGKTKTIQKLTEALSEQGVASLVMDMKGDLSGLLMPGASNSHIEQRAQAISQEWSAYGFPVEFLSLSNQPGVKLRATVTEFGPILFSKMLGLNENQTGIVSMIFQYADDKDLPLIDLKDFKKLIQFLTNEAKEEVRTEYGNISTNSTGTILRKVVELEQQGAELFFGEKSFEVDDLCRIDENGFGYINILRLNDIQDKPKLFSSFMLSLLAEIYQRFPEEGDLDAPKLVIFIDEAHLVFAEASKELQDQLETIIKLIRSKGVGIFFCSQAPSDIPEAILGQLGMKIQHALRAFTAKDRQDIKLAAQNFPDSSFYKTDELLTSMGIGEAIVTVLNEKGIPTPIVHTLLAAPESRMGTITEAELCNATKQSSLVKKYQETIDSESAYEILQAKMQDYKKAAEQIKEEKSQRKSSRMGLGELMLRQASRTIVSTAVRSLLGALVGGSVSASTGRTRRRSKRRY